jgi:hypothetical protein
VKGAGCVLHGLWELGFGKEMRPQVLVECGFLFQDRAGVLLWIQHTDRQMELIDDESHWLEKIRVATHHDGAFVKTKVGIVKQVTCKIHIRAFFLGFDYLDSRRLSLFGICQRHSDIFCEKVPQNDFCRWKRAQSAQISVLPDGLVGIVGAWVELCCEILDVIDVVMGRKVAAAHFQWVEPLAIATLEAAEIQVEPVDENLCLHGDGG